MKNCLRIVIVLPVLLLAAGCFEDSSTNPLEQEDVRFPLKVGNSWTYSFSKKVYAITPENKIITLENFAGTSTWTIETQEPIFSVPSYRIRFDAHYNGGPNSGTTKTEYGWYAQRGDTLIAVADDATSFLDPVTSILFKQTPNPASITAEPVPQHWDVVALVYPLAIGNSWEINFYDFFKKVAAYEKVRVPAGTFKTYKIVRDDAHSEMIDIEHSIEQWISNIGYVKSMYTSSMVENYEYTINGQLIPAGSISVIKEAMVLTNFHLE